MTKYATPLADHDIAERLRSLTGWERDGDQLKRQYKFDSYLSGLAFASAVGVIAEGLDHHPDILIGWRKVTVTVTTHAADNKISEKDFQLAAAIEALPYKPAG